MVTPYYADEWVTLYHGKSESVLPTLATGSVDAVVTDPPYEFGFMGRAWDASGIAYSVDLWREALRVLKPGGHLLAFGGTRTVHRLTCAIEDAGFDIRDGIDWLYGQGFPKSLDVPKAIDRARDDRDDVLVVTSWLADQADRAGITRTRIDEYMGTSDMGGWWLSTLRRRCALPTLVQWDRLRDLIGFGPDMDAEVLRLNLRKGEPGEAWANREIVGMRPARAGDGTVIGLGHTGELSRATSAASRQWAGWGTALKPAREPIVMARKPLSGTVAANVLEYGTGALNIDACRLRTHSEGPGTTPPSAVNGQRASMAGPMERVGYDGSLGRWPTNVVLSHAGNDVDGDLCADECCPDCVVDALDRQSGVLTSGRMAAGTQRANTAGWAGPMPTATGAETIGDSGGASRFFPVFRYEAKADAAERPKVDGAVHPTVKPLALMRWLVQLVTPPGGTVLEPFAGSGTTAEACVIEGFRCIAIEREAAYLPLTVARLAKPIEPVLFGGIA